MLKEQRTRRKRRTAGSRSIAAERRRILKVPAGGDAAQRCAGKIYREKGEFPLSLLFLFLRGMSFCPQGLLTEETVGEKRRVFSWFLFCFLFCTAPGKQDGHAKELHGVLSYGGCAKGPPEPFGRRIGSSSWKPDPDALLQLPAEA